MKPLVDIIAVLKMVRITTPYCAFSRKPFGQRYAKKFHFAATGGWIEFIVRPCTCPDRKHKLMSRNYVVGGKLKFDGKPKDLLASAAYPADLGNQLVLVWLKGDAPELPTSSSSAAFPSWLTPQPSTSTTSTSQTPKRRRTDTSAQASWQQPAP